MSSATAALAAAAAGLRFVSETDHPFATAAWNDAAFPELSAAGLLAALGVPADTPVEEVTVEYFFRNVATAEDWQDEDVRAEAGKYQNLIRVIHAELAGPRVFRVGRRRIDVYIVGRPPAGGVAGLHTVVVET
jgi:hypothetical protein